jgi:hypothetical protein
MELMRRHILCGILALCGGAAASPSWALYDEIVQPTPDGFWGFEIDNPDASALKWSASGGHDGGGYYYIDNWGDEGLFNGDYQAARVYYYMPVLPYDERTYNIYAWNPAAHSDDWHILNINSDGQDLAGSTPNISWAGIFNTNAQWIQYPDSQPPGAWIKLGPGPQTDASVDGGSGVYFNPPDGYHDPTNVGAPKVYAKYQPWYNGSIAFSAIRIVEIVPPPGDGDYDFDGDVDGNDFLVWQRGDSTNGLTGGDLDDWELNFGSSTVATSPVPEPASVLTALVGLCCVGGVAHVKSRRRRSRC